MQLREYQQHAITAVKRDWDDGILNTLLVMATGAGKTQSFLRLIMDELDANPDARALILAHRKELIEQPLDRIAMMDLAWCNRLTDLRPRIGVVMAERDDCDRQLTVATIQTLSSQRRLAKLMANGPITHLVTDECHRAVSASYVKLYTTLREAYPNLRHLGVTATPIRGDGAGLVSVYQKDSAKVTIADLVKMEWLVKPRWLGISTGISIAGIASSGGDFVQSQLAKVFDTENGHHIVVQSYQKYATGRQAVAFTASVAGAHALAEAFRAAGVPAAAIDGTTPKPERTRILSDFKAGRYQVLANCQILVEGWDCPSVSCVLMCRPTKSDLAYTQAIGRGLRPVNGKAQEDEDCLILDFLPADARNVVMAGDVLGLPRSVINEALKKKEGDEDDTGEVQAGFTFDGESFRTDGTPLEIIARKIDYLQSSPFAWDEQENGFLVLGLGVDDRFVNRTLVITPPRADEPQELLGIKSGRDIKSQVIPFATGEFEHLSVLAQRYAEQYGDGSLMQKERSWMKQPISGPQLQTLAKFGYKQDRLARMSRGEASKLITWAFARRALKNSGRAV